MYSCGKSPLFTSQAPEKIIVQNSNSYYVHKLDNSDYSFGLEWIKLPKFNENSPFKLRFWNKNNTLWGPYQAVNNLCVFLWMKMPDGSEHGSSPVVISEIKKADETIYLVNEVYFVMNGVWQIRIRLIEDGQCRSDIHQSFLSEKIIEVSIN